MSNGIAVERLCALSRDIRDDAGHALGVCGVHVEWVAGMQAQATALPMRIGERSIERGFRWTLDEARQLGGGGHGPSAQEALLSGLGASLVSGFAVAATIMGVRLWALDIELHAHFDVGAQLTLRCGSAAAMSGIDYVIRVSGDATPEQFERLREKAQMHNPYAMSLLHGVPLHGRLEASRAI